MERLKDGSSKILWLHREIWRSAHGDIPEGHVVHHKDENPFNNDITNLECLSRADHIREHLEHDEEFRKTIRAASTAALQRARESGKSEEWKRRFWSTRIPVQSNCKFCGKILLSTATRGPALFCKQNCNSSYKRKMGLGRIVKPCAKCGKDFDSFRADYVKNCRDCHPAGAPRTVFKGL